MAKYTDKSMAREPSFTLLARDPEFYALVMEWAQRRENDVNCGERPKSDMAQVREARRLAVEGQKWRVATHGLWRDQ